MALNFDQLMELAMDLGCGLMECGAETYRVEESMGFLLQAYGAKNPEVFAIPNCINLTITLPNGHSVTRIRRVANRNTDIDQMEHFNDLCRKLCRETPPLEKAAELLAECRRSKHEYSMPMQIFGHFLGCGAFAMFFGGDWWDGLCGGLCGILLCLCLWGLNHLGANPYFKTVVGAMVASALAMFFVYIGLGTNPKKIIIGVLMALVPGIAFTNAMRDVMAGDMVAGISKATEALFIGVAIALGTAITLGLIRMLGGG